jgi:hypothetical protein
MGLSNDSPSMVHITEGGTRDEAAGPRKHFRNPIQGQAVQAFVFDDMSIDAWAVMATFNNCRGRFGCYDNVSIALPGRGSALGNGGVGLW